VADEGVSGIDADWRPRERRDLDEAATAERL